jgi:hypothetical protein
VFTPVGSSTLHIYTQTVHIIQRKEIIHTPFILQLPSFFLFFNFYIICIYLVIYSPISIYFLLLSFKLLYAFTDNTYLLHLSLPFPPINSCCLVVCTMCLGWIGRA